MYVTKEAIERVRSSQDLVRVIESRGVKLTRKGRNWVGLCPFHEDHSPSLVVNPARQLWNCFGACRANGGKSGGDVFAFVAKADGVSFLQAMKRLGYEEPTASPGPGGKPRPGSSPKPAPARESSPVLPIPSASSSLNRRELLQRGEVLLDDELPRTMLAYDSEQSVRLRLGVDIVQHARRRYRPQPEAAEPARRPRRPHPLPASGRVWVLNLQHGCFPRTRRESTLKSFGNGSA